MVEQNIGALLEDSGERDLGDRAVVHRVPQAGRAADEAVVVAAGRRLALVHQHCKEPVVRASEGKRLVESDGCIQLERVARGRHLEPLQMQSQDQRRLLDLQPFGGVAELEAMAASVAIAPQKLFGLDKVVQGRTERRRVADIETQVEERVAMAADLSTS